MTARSYLLCVRSSEGDPGGEQGAPVTQPPPWQGRGASEPAGGPLTEAERLGGSEAPSSLQDRAGLWMQREAAHLTSLPSDLQEEWVV